MKNLKNNFDLFIFDLDGTLVDSKKDLCLAVNHALKTCGKPEKSEQELSDLLSQGSRGLIGHVSENDSLFPEIFKLFSKHYEEHLLDHTRFYPGVETVLEQLSSKPKAVMSNKRERFCKLLLEGLKAHHHFELITGGDTYRAKKPDPLPLRKICEHFGVLPHKALMVGDSPVDIESAQKAGLKSIGLLSGFTHLDEMKKTPADLLVEDFAELMLYL